MFIGGSPGSTAGGIKTTTMSIMILSIWSEFRKRKDIECFRRRMEENALRHASCVTMLYGLLILVGSVLIASADGTAIQDALFEAASAIGTVGLSLGITAQLGTVSHIVLILLMFIGRSEALPYSLLSATGLQHTIKTAYGKGICRLIKEEK